jgi:hypothetical protein
VTSALAWDSTTNVKSCVVQEECLLKGGAETDSSPSIDPQLAIHRTRS